MNKTVYIASAYTVGDVARNVHVQMEAANELIKIGFAPFVPLLTHFQHIFYPQTYEKWLEYDFTWVEKCDYLLRIPGESKGADREVEHAKKNNIPVFYSIAELLEYDRSLQ